MAYKDLFEFVATQRERAGALRDELPGFVVALADRGYARSTAKHKIRLVADFGRWLDDVGLSAAELNEQHTSTFLADLRRRERARRCHRATLRILMTVLRDRSVVLPREDSAAGEVDPLVGVELAFTRYLAEERGLQTSTQYNYVSIVRRLLSSRFRGPVRLGELRPRDVTSFVTAETRRSPGRIQVTVPALRVFLRWLYRRGDSETNLAGCVPAVAKWRLATLPKALPSGDVERLLRRSRKKSAVGQRDYAILLVLARLGLRAKEVVAMELDDLDWDDATLRVRGKGQREDRLPLPRDVGRALAAYLRHGRPRCSTRRVFVRARAPYQGFTSSVAICNVVERALKRAGLAPPRKGAHTLRHALACSMLRRGASLADVGQILRHRSPDTTAIYAKVDLVALRSLAPAWPRFGGEA
jgi:site-specific recombinase XerD